jgi:recombinational DNA repair protein (RecF pathway)
VKRTGKSELPLAYFALWTVKLGGWLPAIDRCAFCGKALADDSPAYFAPSASAIACGKCRKPGMRAISAAALSVARRMLGERLDRLSEDPSLEQIAARAAREVSNAMLDVIEHQIDKKLKSRELLEPPAI